jgi:hypothetical protein
VYISPFFTVTASQISVLRGVSNNTARKEYRQIRDSLQLNNSTNLTLRHLASYWQVPVEEITAVLYKFTTR